MAERKNETPKIINLGGSLIVDRASALKSELAAALAASGNVLVSLSTAEELDLACLQVLYAARKSAFAAGKEFHFVGTIPTRVAKRLSAAGVLKGLPERAEDFEAGLVDFN
jgi:anti-anti-sigma regulatory factor